MRNLKKFLALALAVMMTLSLMVTANAAIDTSAAVTDKDSITDEFKEAVAVLNGLGIITGYEDGTFRPDKPISRQETTALVYRLHSGDVEDTKNDLYSTADNIKQFTDVNREGGQKWSAGYIGYCANQGIIKGVSDTRFAPTHEVTGYQVLAMVLRAIGYGQNKEYEGDGWQTRVATTATQLGILKNVNNTNYAATLSGSATRELVAEIVFQAALQDTVTYTAGLGYVKTGSTSLVGGTLGSLSTKNFDLKPGDFQVIDDWGRPGYKWYSGSNPVATIKVNYAKAYDTTTRECDVAHDLEIDTSAKYRLFVNSDEFITDNYLIVATDTVTKVGGQGRITEFYDELHHPHKNNTWPASVVMIDTFLGKVTKVEDRVLDAKEHVMIPAKLYVNMYDSVTDTEANGTPVVLENSSANWAFAKGDFITLNAYTNHAQGIDANDVSSRHDRNDAERNEAAFEAEKVLLKADGKTLEHYAKVAKVEPVLGKQTTIYWNQGKHNVDNVDKLDQLDLHLDVAGTTTDTTFAWYYDAKGNLIGIGNVPNTINYGIITSIYSSFKQGDSQTDGNALAIATVKYADGTEGTVSIDRFLMNSGVLDDGSWKYGEVAQDTAAHHTAGTAMTDTSVAPVNTAPASAELLPAYDLAAANAMTATPRNNATKANNAVQAGWLNIAPVAGVNATSESTITAPTTPWGNAGTSSGGTYGVIRGNLFKFVNSADGYVTAIEVAGNGNTANTVYTGHHNEAVATSEKTLSKNLAFLTVDTTTIRMDNDTKIMVRGCEVTGAAGSVTLSKATNTVNTYDGIDELPASIVVPKGSEVDWADTDGNGIADVVYVYGNKEGTTGYGLFYYNGGAGQWTGSSSDGSGWLRGWLGNTQTDLVFNDKDMFDRVQRSTLTYGGHLFAVKLIDGEVDSLLGDKAITGNSGKNQDYFLIDTAGTITPRATAVALSALVVDALTNMTDGIVGSSSNDGFKFGTTNGNDYSDSSTAPANNTSAIWYHDEPSATDVATGYTDVVYNNSNNTIEIYKYDVEADGRIKWHNNGAPGYTRTAADVVYNLSGTSDKLGDDLYFLNMAGRVNDVTIVFEDNANDTIRHIYVTTRADITAPGQDGNYGASAGTPGAGVDTLPKITDNDLLTASIKGFGPGSVVYSPEAKTLAAGTSDPEQFLYFPFTVGATAENVTLTIRNSSGKIVYMETNEAAANMGTAATSANNTYYFVINFVTGTGNANASVHEVLTADSYSYQIVGYGTGDVLSSGTFTMN